MTAAVAPAIAARLFILLLCAFSLASCSWSLTSSASVLTIEEIESCLWWWSAGEYAATALVVIGVFGEYVADFTEWAKKKPDRKDWWGKRATLVLIIGLVGELTTLVQVNRYAGLEIALIQATTENLRADNLALSRDIANANTRLAEAERAAADAKRDAVRAYLLVAPRQLRWTEEMRSLSRFAGTKLIVRYDSDRDNCEDCETFSDSFRILRDLGWEVAWIPVHRRLGLPTLGASMIMPGVTLLSHRPIWWESGTGNIPPEPEGGYGTRDRTWVAGAELAKFLRMTSEVETSQRLLDLGGGVDPSQYGENLSLGEDSLVIEIGARSVLNDLQRRILDEQWNAGLKAMRAGQETLPPSTE